MYNVEETYLYSCKNKEKLYRNLKSFSKNIVAGDAFQNLFVGRAYREIFSKSYEIRLYLPYTDWFETSKISKRFLCGKYDLISFWFNKICLCVGLLTKSSYWRKIQFIGRLSRLNCTLKRVHGLVASLPIRNEEVIAE